MDETLKQIEKFHGHLGPYVVVGYRIGKIANEKLGLDPFSKKAVVWTGTKPPISCTIDGIQLSSGCTLGKGNITIKHENLVKAEFSRDDRKQVVIILKPNIRNEIDTTVTEKNIVSYSEQLYKKSDKELFEIK